MFLLNSYLETFDNKLTEFSSNTNFQDIQEIRKEILLLGYNLTKIFRK